MRYASNILREIAVNTISRRTKRVRLTTVDEMGSGTPTELRMLALVCALLLVAAVAVYQRLDNTPRRLPPARKPVSSPQAQPLSIVPKDAWRAMTVAPIAPAAVRALDVPGLSFQWTENLPVAELDGAAIQHRVPAALWLKLEQPGNAYLLLETNEGVFVKPLEDASPGFVSRVATAENYGTVAGQPAYLEERDVHVERLWIVQDASANPRQTPGYVALIPPEEAPSGLVVANVR